MIAHNPFFADHSSSLTIFNMSGHKKNRNDPNSGDEDFTDISSTPDSDEEFVTQDQWVFPVVSRHAKRDDYDMASP